MAYVQFIKNQFDDPLIQGGLTELCRAIRISDCVYQGQAVSKDDIDVMVVTFMFVSVNNVFITTYAPIIRAVLLQAMSHRKEHGAALPFFLRNIVPVIQASLNGAKPSDYFEQASSVHKEIADDDWY